MNKEIKFKVDSLKFIVVLLLSFAIRLSPLYAQGVIDEVIWVVGDEAILRSEVEEERVHNTRGKPSTAIPIV